jgi:predicted RNase H-like HicB family nuclease
VTVWLEWPCFNVEVWSMRTFAAYVEWDPDTQLYVGFVPGIAGAHTQGQTLDELHKNLKEVLELCLEEYRTSGEELPRFVGLQQIEVAG